MVDFVIFSSFPFQTNITSPTPPSAPTSAHPSPPLAPSLAPPRRKENGFASPATRPKNMRYTTIADNLVGELGRIGQKVGKGWYDYDPSKGKGRLPIVSPEVADFVNKHRLKVGIASGGVSLSNDEIVNR